MKSGIMRGGPTWRALTPRKSAIVDERETPEAGDEWTTKALLLGAELHLDRGYGHFMLWAAKVPGGKEFYGVTQARACRKLVRSFTGDAI
jgi:hypothetical protein